MNISFSEKQKKYFLNLWHQPRHLETLYYKANLSDDHYQSRLLILVMVRKLWWRYLAKVVSLSGNSWFNLITPNTHMTITSYVSLNE
jgi:hypothetical protein